MDLIFLDKVKENKQAFADKVISISKDLNIQPNWLMAVMDFESGLNSRAVNRSTGATGLIQFMPDTAKGLKTNVMELKDMPNVKQLDYVKAYLMPYKNKFKSYIDVYFAVFFPLAIGLNDNEVIQAKRLSSSLIAKQNPVFDLNRDNQITVAEIKQAFVSKIPENLRDFFFYSH